MSECDLKLEKSPCCPLCGLNESTHVDSCDDTLIKEINRSLPPSVPRINKIRNFRRVCTFCGLVYLSPRVEEASLSKIYELWYSYTYCRVVEDEAHIADRMREFSRYHFRTLSSAMPKSGRLLDVGCGSGLFMQVARKAGWDVVGIEWDGHIAAAGRSRFGLDIRQGTLHNALRENEKFDAITLFDYLEHSRKPGADLDLLCKHIRKGGCC